MLLSEQIRAARMLLNWNQEDLAKNAGVSPSTLKRMEARRGPATGHAESVWRVQAALEAGGIEFTPGTNVVGPGVRLREPYVPK